MKSVAYLYAIVFVLTLLRETSTLSYEDYPFRNVSLPWYQRIEDLIARLDLTEVALQMAGSPDNGTQISPGIPRLGILPYTWETECLRGSVESGPATSFPQAISLAASFDTSLISSVSRATGMEVRAKNNYFSSHGIYSRHTGLSCLSPVINLMRHPFWGRNQETYGEDPYLTGELAKSFVQGLQDTHKRPESKLNRYYLVNAVCKHFAAHNGPENIPVTRFSFDARASLKDLQLSFLPQFRKCLDSGALGVMCSYNRLNGVPNCANKWLLDDVLRKEWNFTGYIISDEGALEFMVIFHKYYKSFEDAAVGAVDAGVNFEIVLPNIPSVYQQLLSAVSKGRLKEAELRKLLIPLFYARFRLGQFDPKDMNPYSFLNASQIVQSAAHQELSLLSATNSMVLLKNSNNFLPLKRKYKKIALVGPFATNMSMMYGDYSADRMPHYEIPVSEGLKEFTSVLDADSVCLDGPQCLKYNDSNLSHTLKEADITVMALGLGIQLEEETKDRANMSFPPGQLKLISSVIRYLKQFSSGNKRSRLLVLIFSAGPVDLQTYGLFAAADGILWCGYPAQTAGKAVSYILSSRRVPSARLPFTWYHSDEHLQSITDYRMNNLTYRYYTGLTLFSFGFGLSYTKFIYSDLKAPVKVVVGADLLLSVTLTNKGPFDADEIVQVYFSWPIEMEMPQRQLVYFRKLSLTQKTISVDIKIPSGQTWVWYNRTSASSNGLVPFRGSLYLSVGGGQPQSSEHDEIQSNVLLATVIIT